MKNLKKAAKQGKAAAQSANQQILTAAHSSGASSGSSATLAAYVPGSAVDRFLLIVKVFRVRNLKWTGLAAKTFTKFRPTVAVQVQQVKIGQTGVGTSKVDEPTFNESFFAVTSSFLPRASPGALVQITLQDFDLKLGINELGSFTFAPKRATGPQSWDPEWYPTKNNVKGEGEVLVAGVFVPCDEAIGWTETPMGDFPMRTGNDVRLYQDAYCPVPFLSHMQPRNAFEDMYESLSGAKQFIYMTGWSVWTKLNLLRGKECPSLGKLLADKAEQGLQVCVLIWDELTSVDGSPMAGGLMSTFDEETRAFFKDTKVSCRTLHRYGYQGFEEAVMSHHQKTIICDTAAGNIHAYVGGLDVTNGRWDTPEHRIFSSLDNDHKDDFYSACVPGATAEVGPRQPWHDIHSRLEGAVAVDVYENFRQRWEMVQTAGGGKVSEKPVAPIAALKGVAGAKVSTTGSWNCQLLRSIDRYSIESKGEADANVIRSIHNTYVLRICTAQRFIYVENQYFMGSSHFWDSKIDPGLRNLVPILIVEKIISKIVAKQDFTAYIIVPMFPEGLPDSVGVQAMLRWQFLTVSMMYKRIFDALKTNNVTERTVEDYLVFMCVNNREEPPKGVVGKKHGTVENGRHTIYVHSKMIIVDDEFILIGSANINDRSLRGDRDTEIAVICNQRPPPPNPPPPHSNELHDFRLSLWCEHFGGMDELYRHPQNPMCARHVQSLCVNNWEKYTADDNSSRLKGHACKYPYVADANGVLKAAGNGKFPDYPLADIEGKLSALPNHVTT
uniref:phospholipase D n=1 Tax=Paramoeba aestuarina TaxID=180227 RepID=A0A7S4UW95_9EUKA|mmetsp:Transcript_52/g.106  ORF Transcript_52/g.106 Transcript_52/m.106 type:complete len:782 (+) Transcript_52:56-2401(+)|eukprot:CAMPEP_0201520796 /NCGR_PEP_ID=MMETSP0161_2-20130828/12605_1 /ASSEMBLY_ACC=CAM_ASM_000251 /TAXON_ID=180227 /ORGANISM="Neoparamoeba aestuarina, Strain SoJaBio B1-5/56/2" /LENGTH=781 /DNA_ID=CAMNT_0047919281 /DNA_START=42 /DNA_END=2387 /DNA_ORIENTATION=+